MTRKIDGDNVLFMDGDKKVLGMYPQMDEEGTVLVTLEGDIRRELSTMFQDEIASLLSAKVNVVLDFDKLIYISYGAMIGLLELEHTAEKENLRLKIRGLKGDVLEKIESVAFNQLLDIE